MDYYLTPNQAEALLDLYDYYSVFGHNMSHLVLGPDLSEEEYAQKVGNYNSLCALGLATKSDLLKQNNLEPEQVKGLLFSEGTSRDYTQWEITEEGIEIARLILNSDEELALETDLKTEVYRELIQSLTVENFESIMAQALSAMAQDAASDAALLDIETMRRTISQLSASEETIKQIIDSIQDRLV